MFGSHWSKMLKPPSERPDIHFGHRKGMPGAVPARWPITDRDVPGISALECVDATQNRI